MSLARKTYVTRRFEFCYGHFLPEYNGKCCVQHGHNSVLEVEVARDHTCSSEAHRIYSGMVIDFGDLKALVAPILENLDHKNLNDLEYFEFRNPTAENLLMYIRDEIRERLFHLVQYDGLVLTRLRIYETPNCYAEWRD